MRRVQFVDILRLLALLQMINGHTLDAVLSEQARLAPGFEHYRFARGLVSVAFMVVAGISFYLTTLARFERHRADPKAVQRRFRRATEIVLVGYLLQVRWSGVYFDPAQSHAAFAALFRCEVLQCIGFSLVALELITLLARRAEQVVWGSLLSALTLFMLAPFGELLSLHAPSSPVAALLGHGQQSQFPLLPWSGYVFVGVVLGRVALPHAGQTPLLRRVLGLLAVAISSFALSRMMLPLNAVFPKVIASSTPWFVVEKLSAIALVLALLALVCHRIGALPRALTILGGETMAIFVFHLQVIYGGSWALYAYFARALPLERALLASLLNLMLSVAFALGWHQLKARLRAKRQRSESLLESQSACSLRSAT